MTRSAVVAWQKCMKKESNRKRIEKVVQRKMWPMPHSTSSTNNPQHLQQTQSFVLASVSSKCSKVSREEALWRGNIDFRVAYPERCRYGVRDGSPKKKRSVVGTGAHDVSKRRRSSGCGAYSGEVGGNYYMKMSAAHYAEV